MGGAPSLPTANTPGYTTFRGRVACVCLARWLPVFERLLLAAGEIRFSLDVVQLTGGAAASGGTHTQGGAFDVKQRTPNAVRLGREMGAPAFWARTGPAWVGNEHAHGVLLGCPHNGPAAYQLAAQRAGFDGLGKATSGRFAGMWGYGGRDPHPGPGTYRTWEQGIAWAEQEIARLTKPAPAPAPTRAPAPKPAPQEVPDMQFTDKIPGRNENVGQALARALWAYEQIIEGGSIDRRLDNAVAGLGELRVALSQGNVADAQAILDRIEVSLSVKPDTPPAA